MTLYIFGKQTMAAKAQEKRIDMESLIDSHQSRRSQMLVCALAIIALLIGAFVIVILHHCQILLPTNQTAHPKGHKEKIIITRELTNASAGTHDLLTVDKSAKYLIFGCVKFSKASDENATLKLVFEENSRSIPPTIKGKNLMCFWEERILVGSIIIKLSSKSTLEEGFFWFREL
ncbi:hypothetical protein OJAV_G00036750 [Oryzias javanicus]|uniref:Uncharacterized protein n=1 Tax=Oryzias javanicus TaxID=123683 RepID=A0A3S2PF03_ORYJA|nr:hypothetical protein OJAV_G00036750 [Oryzias javanicus]